jgi:hypothetical protein
MVISLGRRAGRDVSRRVVALNDTEDESTPLTLQELKDRTRWVLRITDENAVSREGHLDALARITCAAPSP